MNISARLGVLMHESLVPALRMGTIGPLNRWVGSSAVVLANQAAIYCQEPPPKVACFSTIIDQLLVIAAWLANTTALEPTHPSSGPIVPILRAGTKLSYNYTLS